MYPWIWRHLPFGLPGRIVGSLLLAGAAVALLWFVVFPWTSPWVEEVLLPFDESTIETDPSSGTDDPGMVEDSGEPEDPHDIPYDTDG